MRDVQHVIRIKKAREYWFELLIAFPAIAGMLELVVGPDWPGAPRTTLGVAVPAVTVLVPPCWQLSMSIPSPTCWTVPDQQENAASTIASIKVGERSMFRDRWAAVKMR